MELTVGGGTPHADPSPEQIASALASLGESADAFAILGESELTYVQTSGTPADGFVLEYQLGSLDRHFRSQSDSLPLETVTEAFVLYASGDRSWRDVTAWQHEEPGAGGSLFWRVLVGVVAMLAALAYLAARSG